MPSTLDDMHELGDRAREVIALAEQFRGVRELAREPRGRLAVLREVRGAKSRSEAIGTASTPRMRRAWGHAAQPRRQVKMRPSW